MADDLGVTYTDRKQKDIERSLRRIYKQAQDEIAEKTNSFFEKAAEKEKKLLKQVEDGSMTQKEFDDWKAGKVFAGENWKAQQENIAKVLANTNDFANSMIRGEQFNVFAFNANYTAYNIENGFGTSFGFDLYSKESVSRLIKDKPNILPFKKLDKKKDERWNFKNIRSQIAQGILQGESIPKIAERLASVVPNRNQKQMVLHARTAMTAAQNGGRMERYQEAEDLGIKFKKVWLATGDERTRETHIELDGQAVDPNEPFEVDGMEIMYPGDPHAEPELVYNCRCTMVTELDDYPRKFTEKTPDQSFKEWEDSKNGED